MPRKKRKKSRANRSRLKRLSNILWITVLSFSLVLSIGATVVIGTKSPSVQNWAENVKLHVVEGLKLPQDPRYLNKISYEWLEKKPQDPITFMLTGDMMFGRYIKVLRSQRGGRFPLSYVPEMIDQIKTDFDVDSVSFVAGNLEGPISDSNYVNPGTSTIFNFEPEIAPLLKEAGFNTVATANNHTLDMGAEAFGETQTRLIKAGVTPFGDPRGPQADSSYSMQYFRNRRIGFLGLNDAVTNLDEAGALQAIEHKSRQSDFLIVSVHWGPEYQSEPTEKMRELAREWIDAGADFIWGHHSHVIGESEVYQGVPIYYSLGNFVFDQFFSPETQTGLVLGLKLTGGELEVKEYQVDLSGDGEPRMIVSQPQIEAAQ